MSRGGGQGSTNGQLLLGLNSPGEENQLLVSNSPKTHSAIQTNSMAFEAGNYTTCMNCNGIVAQSSSKPSESTELTKSKLVSDLIDES